MITGRCMCGATRYAAEGEILWAALCHCEDCQRAAGDDYVSWFGVLKAGTTWDGPRKTFRSSEKVVRSFCGTCGTPMSFDSQVFEDETHLYAPSLDDRSLYRPRGHIFWGERVPWYDGTVNLPCHEKGLQSAAADGRHLNLGG